MALPSKKTTFTFNHADQVDNYAETVGNSAIVKSNFDSRAAELLTYINQIYDALQATTDGASGADQIKATAISGLTGDTVQELLEAIADTADPSNYLAKNNTTEFTPDADYEPATKKYVDDNAGGSAITDTVTIASGETLSAGDLVNINDAGEAERDIKTLVGDATALTGSSAYNITHLVGNKYVIVYASSPTADKGEVCIATIVRGVITFGEAFTFSTTYYATSRVRVLKLTDSKFCIIFRNSACWPLAIIGEVDSDDNITFGTALTLRSDAVAYINGCVLSEDLIAVSYQYNNYTRCVMVSISDTTLTKESGQYLQYKSYQYMSLVRLSDLSFAVIQNSNHSNQYYLDGYVCSVDASTYAVTKGSIATHGTTSLYPNQAIYLSENKIAVYYHYNSSVYLVIATISGTVVTFGTPVSFSSGTNYESTLVRLEDDVFVVVYSYGATKLYCRKCTVSGTTITTSDAIEVYSEGARYPKSVCISAQSIVTLYKKISDSSVNAVVNYIDANFAKEAIVTAVGSSNCDICYDGIIDVSGIAKNTEIQSPESPSIYVYAPIANKLSVRGYWKE